MLLLLLALIFIRPFISSLTYPLGNFFYSSALFGVIALSLIRQRPSPPGKGALGNPLCQGVRNPLLLFIFALLLCVAFSSGRTAGFLALYHYAVGILLFIFCATRGKKEIDAILRAMVFAGLLISIYALYQYFFGFARLSAFAQKYKLTDPFLMDIFARKRVFFPFITPNILGGYLAMIIMLALNFRKDLWRLIPLAAALILTQSLGALFSALLALILYFYLTGKLKKGAIFFLGGFAAIAAVIILVRLFASPPHAQPAFSFSMRLRYWLGALQVIRLHPITGIGIGNFNLPASRFAHNSYLQLCAETGVIGIIAFLWLIVRIAKNALLTITDPATICLFCAFLVFLLHNLVDFSFFLPEASFIWWAIAGLLISRSAADHAAVSSS